jgi:2-oxoglutarate ferredoxin oxidoreductase subunit alpha
MARYTEESEPYVRNMDRLLKKWDTIKSYLPAPEWQNQEQENEIGMLYFGTSESSSLEAADLLAEKGIHLDLGRIRAFPFHPSIADFIQDHQKIFVVEQNRDAQMRTLLINELEVDPARLIPVLNYDGLPITGLLIHDKIMEHIGYASTTLTDQHDLRKTSFSAS